MSASMSSRRKIAAAIPAKKVSVAESKEVPVETFISVFLVAVGVILLTVARDTGSMLAFISGAAGLIFGVRHIGLRFWDAIRGNE